MYYMRCDSDIQFVWIICDYLCTWHFIDDEAEEQKKKKVGTSFKGKRDQGMQESQKDLTLCNKDDNYKKKRVFKRIIRTKKQDGTITTREVPITDPKEVWII